MRNISIDIDAFKEKSQFLSYEEIGILVSMQMQYAKTEAPLSGDWVNLAFRNVNQKSVESVLKLFFNETEEGYVSREIEKGISEKKTLSEKRRNAVKNRWQKYKCNTNVIQLYNNCNTSVLQMNNKSKKVNENNELELSGEEGSSYNITNIYNNKDNNNIKREKDNNFVIIEKEKKDSPIANAKARLNDLVKPQDCSDEIWLEYQQYRKGIKKPLNSHSLALLTKEASKARISTERAMQIVMENGWQGFKASYVSGFSNSQNYSLPTDQKSSVFNRKKTASDLEEDRIWQEAQNKFAGVIPDLDKEF